MGDLVLSSGISWGSLRLAKNVLGCMHLKFKDPSDSLVLHQTAQAMREQQPECDLVLYVERKDPPPDITASLALDPRFAADLDRYCRYAAFCTLIESEVSAENFVGVEGFTLNPHQSEGDNLSPKDGSQTITSSLDVDAKVFGEEMVPHLGQTIFINLFRSGKPLYGPNLLWALLQGTARLKMCSLLKDYRELPCDVGAFYASHYKREAALAFRKLLLSIMQDGNRAEAEQAFIATIAQIFGTLRGRALTETEVLAEIGGLYQYLDGQLRVFTARMKQHYRGTPEVAQSFLLSPPDPLSLADFAPLEVAVRS